MSTLLARKEEAGREREREEEVETRKIAQSRCCGVDRVEGAAGVS